MLAALGTYSMTRIIFCYHVYVFEFLYTCSAFSDTAQSDANLY